MKKLVRSAAYRIAFAYSAAVALAILLLGTSVYFAADHEFRRQRDREIGAEASRIASLADVPSIIHDVDLRSRVRGHDAYLYALFDPHEQRIAGRLDARAPALGLADTEFRDGCDPADMARTMTVAVDGGYRLTVGYDAEPIERINKTILALFGIGFAVVLALGTAGALLLGGYLRRRLASISDTAAAIIAGDLDKRVFVGPHGDEFDEAGQALNASLDRIGQLMDSLRHVSSDVAHDLRTPLVRLRAQLALVGREEGAAERALEQGDALLALFAAILRIAEVEGGAAAARGPVDLSTLAIELAEAFQPALADAGRSLTWRIAPHVHVAGDRELLAQALANLLDNARVHSRAGANIALTLTGTTDTATLTVADDGPGVPAADRSRLLDRFVRAEASRGSPGHGLGLSLVRAIVGAHGGEVVLSDAAPGLRISLSLPALRDADQPSVPHIGK